MSSTAQVAELEVAGASAGATAGKPSMATLVIVMVITGVLTMCGAAGTVIYLTKSGRLGAGGVPAAATAVKVAEVKPATHALVMEPILVNLADADGHSYLRVGITLEVADAAKKKGEKVPEKKEDKVAAEVSAPLRDAILAVLGRQRPEDLLAGDGKDRLKQALMASILEHVPEPKVTEIYFTDFLVQR